MNSVFSEWCWPAILAWKFSTYGFNLYYGQGHVIDRLLLVFLFVLIWFRTGRPSSRF